MRSVKELVEQLPQIQDQFLEAELLRERRIYEADPANFIVLPSTLSKSHHLVKARLELEKRCAESSRVPLHALQRPTDLWARRAAALPLYVSGPQIIRALSIYDAILRAAATRDMECWLIPNRLRVYSNHGVADLRLSETSLNALRNNWSGRLKLSIESGAGPVRYLIDMDEQPLEGQLNEAMVMIANASVQSKKWLYYMRERQQREAAQLVTLRAAAVVEAEEKRINEDKAARIAALISEADSWRAAENLRTYARHLEETAYCVPDLMNFIQELRHAAREVDSTCNRIADLQTPPFSQFLKNSGPVVDADPAAA